MGGKELPALVIAWVHGRSREPDKWFAEIVVRDTDLEGRTKAVEMLVAADELTPVGRTDGHRPG